MLQQPPHVPGGARPHRLGLPAHQGEDRPGCADAALRGRPHGEPGHAARAAEEADEGNPGQEE